MEDKQQNGISYEEWAEILLENPERYKEAIDSVDNPYNLYNAVFSMQIDISEPSNNTKYNFLHNQKINNLLKNINEYYDSPDRKAPTKETISDELKLDIQSDLNSYINIGYPPDKLIEVCKQYGYKLEQIYTESELVEKYADYGITYNPKEGSLNAPWFSQTRYFTPSLQQSKQQEIETPLSIKESELSALEAEAAYLDEAEAALKKETEKDEI